MAPSDPRAEDETARAWALEALASIEDGVVVTDACARVVYLNPAAARVVAAERLGPDPALWASAFDVMEPDEVTRFRAEERPLMAALRGEARHGVALFARTPSIPKGIHLVCNASPLRDRGGALRGAVLIFHDVTEQRARQLAHTRGERQKRAILDNIPDMAWLKDREGRFLAVNRRFAEAAALDSPERAIGLTDLDLWPRDLAERYRADDEEVMLTGLHKKIEERLVDARGASTWIETAKTRILGEQGEVIGTTGIARDVTKRRAAEEELRSLNDQLARGMQQRTSEVAIAQEALVRRERLAVLGQLAGGVAHQIRNPLASIMNASYVLKRHLPPDRHPHVEDAIRIIHDEVRHANVIITGLLDFARVRAPDRHPTSLLEVVERVLAAEAVPDGVRIARVIEDVPPLVVDANQIQAALGNLVRNALEAMPDGGVLGVEVRVDQGRALVAVSDSGPGISPQVNLFEPLHSTKPSGIGLGLVTARTFVEAHGGEIRSAEAPKGARFEVRLPLP